MNTIEPYRKVKSGGCSRTTIAFTLLLTLCGCEGFISVPEPGTQLNQENVFKDDATAIAAMSGVYIKLADGLSFADGGSSSVTLFAGLYADELISFSSVSSSSPRVEFYFNTISPFNGIASSTWTNAYKIIYECNRILEGLDNAEGNLTEALKVQIRGECLFIRAFSHFYLTNLFGDVPIITTSDYKVNATVSRKSVNDVYAQIISDLTLAKDLLTDSYPSAGRVRVNKGAATAMLARVYLYTNDFENAEIEATEVINKSSQYRLHDELTSVFLATSEEAIWQLLPGGGLQYYTNEGSLFILLAPPTTWALRNELYQSFETGDLRKSTWVGSLTSTSGNTTWYFPYKYKGNIVNATGAEYSMVLRLAEQYLIRAESRLHQNKLLGPNSAESDINIIRTRAGLPPTTALTTEELRNDIERERKFEFFTEWGHRFFDLKRTGRLDAVLSVSKPNWNSTDELLPIPQSEILLNENLKPQNQGY